MQKYFEKFLQRYPLNFEIEQLGALADASHKNAFFLLMGSLTRAAYCKKVAERGL